MPSLIDAIGFSRSVLSFVGAGGKKTSMYQLARSTDKRVLMTSTSHMYPYDEAQIDQLVIVDDEAEVPLFDSSARVVAVASDTDTDKRIGGIPAAQIKALIAANDIDLCLIKADGARARWLKAPAEYEPIIPEFSDATIPVMSVKTVGRPLDERIAHRPERIAEIVGARVGEDIRPEHLIKLLISDEGSLKGVGNSTVIPLINMVDDEQLTELALDIAREALKLSNRFDKIICASAKFDTAEVVRI